MTSLHAPPSRRFADARRSREGGPSSGCPGRQALLPRGLLAGATVAALAFAPDSAHADALDHHGCLGCHSVDGRSGAGPTLAGLSGATRRVSVAGADAEHIADEAYVRRAITDPSAEVVEGYPAVMPVLPLTDAELDALVAEIMALPPADPPFEALWPLALACSLFVSLHFVLSGPLRAALVGRLGESRFQGLYSLAVALPFAGMFAGWHYAPFVPLWTPPAWTSHVSLLLMLPALFLVVAGYTTPGPTLAGMAGKASEGPRGILTVTRHPSLWGFLLWGLVHLATNGDAASVILFLGFVVLSAGGMVHIEARRRRAPGADWETFAAHTSVMPFAAIVRRRTRLDLGGWAWRFALTLVLYAAIVLLSHEWLMGVSPLPEAMRPAW